MRNDPADNLEFALLADGVPMDKIYPGRRRSRVSENGSDQEVRFRCGGPTGGQSAQVLVDKEAVLGTAWNGRYYSAIKQGAPIAIEWNQGAIKESTFGIPKGAKDVYWAQKLLAVMAEAKPQGRLRQCHRLSRPQSRRDQIHRPEACAVPADQSCIPVQAVLDRRRVAIRERGQGERALGALDAREVILRD